MAHRRGYHHQVTFDHQTVWLNSKTEFLALERLVQEYGFSAKWLRPQYGIKHNGKSYTPDFELSVDDYGKTTRALLEIKQYRNDFTKSIAERMCAVARHYHTDQLYLYTVKTDRWYKVLDRNTVRECKPPLPGRLSLDQLLQPKRLLTRNYYGRRYYQSISDKIMSFLGKL